MFFGTVETELKTMWFAPLMLGLGAAHHQNLAKEDMELRDFFAGHGLRRSRLSVDRRKGKQNRVGLYGGKMGLACSIAFEAALTPLEAI